MRQLPIIALDRCGLVSLPCLCFGASLLQSVVSSMSHTNPLAPAHVQIPYTPVISHVRKAVIVCCRGEISAEEPEHVASGIAAALSVQGKATPFYSITAKLLLLGACI